MKWRLWAACGMLVLILCTGTLVQYRVGELCDDLRRLLEEPAAEEPFARAKTLWDSHVTVLSVLIHHDRIDNITESFARAEAFMNAETEDEYRAETAQLRSKLTWLRDYDKPGFRSIF